MLSSPTEKRSQAKLLEDYGARIVEQWPRPTDAQRDRLAALLAPAGGASE